jgi:hypothetical protein
MTLVGSISMQENRSRCEYLNAKGNSSLQKEEDKGMKSLTFLTPVPLFVLLVSTPPAGAQVIRQEQCLPPRNSAYVGRFHQQYPNGVDLSNPRHYFFDHCFLPSGPPPVGNGAEQVEDVFDSTVQTTLTPRRGGPAFCAHAPAHVTVRVRFRRKQGNTWIYDTNMTQLDIKGGNLPPGAQIRASPTKPSLGETRITTLRNGSFKIESFFDINTELSMNNGRTWLPANAPGHVSLTETVLTRLTLTPIFVKGGKKFRLEVEISTEAPVGGAVVTLTNTNSAARVPASVTIPECQNKVAILVDTQAVRTPTPGEVSASYGSVTRTRRLTVTP